MIDQARQGGPDALGGLLERHRHELKAAARAMLGREPQPGIDPSDMVQETFLKANRGFTSFKGNEEFELRRWLHEILTNCLHDQWRYHARRVRARRREVPLETLGLNSRSNVPWSPAARGPSPSESAARREQADLLAAAVAKMPEDRRKLYELRVLHRLEFEEIATRMNRSAGATRMLWARVVEELGATLGKDRA